MDSLTGAAKTWRMPDASGLGGRKGSTGKGHQITIAEQAELWQTPATDSFRSRGGDRKDEQGLDQQARMFATPESWPTPNVSDAKTAGGCTEEFRQRRIGKMGEKSIKLSESVLNNFPTSLPAPAIPDGPRSSSDGPTSRRHLVAVLGRVLSSF